MNSGWVMSASPYCYCDGSRFKGQQSAFISQTLSFSLSLSPLSLFVYSVSLLPWHYFCLLHTHINTKVEKHWEWEEADTSLLCQTHTPHILLISLVLGPDIFMEMLYTVYILSTVQISSLYFSLQGARLCCYLKTKGVISSSSPGIFPTHFHSLYPIFKWFFFFR